MQLHVRKTNIGLEDNRKYRLLPTGLHSAVSSMSDSRARDPGFDTWSGHILLFLLLLIQEEQLSVTGESMYGVLVNHLGGISLPRKSLVGSLTVPTWP